MLCSLSIRNFILIDQLDLELSSGFCVITGETGSGKSIILDSLLFCLGYKNIPSPNKIDSQPSSVTLVFSNISDSTKQILEDLDIIYEDEIAIKRTQLSGKKKFFVNDQLISQSTIEQLSNHLFELYGQMSHTALINPKSHIHMLDQYGNLGNLVQEVSKCFEKYKEIYTELKQLQASETTRVQEIDYLEFVVKELTDANIKINEENALNDIRIELQNRDKEIELITNLLSKISSQELDQSISSSLKIIGRTNNAVLEPVGLHLENAYNNLEAARALLQNMQAALTHQEHDIEDINTRLFFIKDLARKYSISSNEFDTFLEANQHKLQKLKAADQSCTELNDQLNILWSQYLEKATTLSSKRKNIVHDLEGKIQDELKSLYMQNAVFKVNIEQLDESQYSKYGIDTVRFIASTNPGSSPAPIEKIASGGELSRFMLALRTTLFATVQKSTIIFDEIDTGIGGVVSDSVGDRLKQLSTSVQVIVVTHQPQVACKADMHILISKAQTTNSTSVNANILSMDQRTLEIARMLSGKNITESSIIAAKELISSKKH